MHSWDSNIKLNLQFQDIKGTKVTVKQEEEEMNQILNQPRRKEDEFKDQQGDIDILDELEIDSAPPKRTRVEASSDEDAPPPSKPTRGRGRGSRGGGASRSSRIEASDEEMELENQAPKPTRGRGRGSRGGGASTAAPKRGRGRGSRGGGANKSFDSPKKTPLVTSSTQKRGGAPSIKDAFARQSQISSISGRSQRSSTRSQANFYGSDSDSD